MCVRCSPLVSCSLKHNHSFPLSLPSSSLSAEAVHPQRPHPALPLIFSYFLSLSASFSCFYKYKEHIVSASIKVNPFSLAATWLVVNLSRACSVFQLAQRSLVDRVGCLLGWWIWVQLTRWFRIHSRNLSFCSLLFSFSVNLQSMTPVHLMWSTFKSTMTYSFICNYYFIQ